MPAPKKIQEQEQEKKLAPKAPAKNKKAENLPEVTLPVDRGELSIKDAKQLTVKVQQLLSAVMKENVHYGVVPGTKNKSLWKAGADKISLTFRLRPQFTEEVHYLEGGHLDVSYHCSLVNIPTGIVVAEGVGSCSTLERKYRYRNRLEFTNVQPSKDYWRQEKVDIALAELKRKQKKIPDKAKIITQKSDTDGKVYYAFLVPDENPDIGDLYNTVRKMGKKRAHVDATITAVAASDMFSQDIEELREAGYL